MDPESLIEELARERAAFFEALASVSEESMTTPGLDGDWSGRELIAHVGYWTGHAGELIHEVEQGRIDEVGVGQPPTDEVNETVARIARTTGLATVRRREAASFDALVDGMRRMEPSLLDLVLPDGASVAQGIREDGAEHYRQHADELRAALTEKADA
jgi:mycothiol maleylpyruvate isomerase-like protein